MEEKKDYFTLFAWKWLPVVEGAFTLREILSAEFIHQLEIDVDLDQVVTYFEYAPCTGETVLGFGHSQLTVEIDFVWADFTFQSRDNTTSQTFSRGWNSNLSDVFVKFIDTVKYDEKYDCYKTDTIVKRFDETVETKEKLNSFVTLMPYIEKIGMRLENGEIVDYEGWPKK